MSHDARDICRLMADGIEASARDCIAIGAVEKGERMLKWAAELREQALNIDEDGYDLIQQGHA